MIWIFIAPIASIMIAWFEASRCPIVSCWYNSIITVDYDCSDWALHAIWSPSCDISNFHKVLFPKRSKMTSYFIYFLLYGRSKIFECSIVVNPHSYILQAFMELLILILCINFAELMILFKTRILYALTKVW